MELRHRGAPHVHPRCERRIGRSQRTRANAELLRTLPLSRRDRVRHGIVTHFAGCVRYCVRLISRGEDMEIQRSALAAVLAIASLAVLSNFAVTQDKAATGCVITTTRTACAGKEA